MADLIRKVELAYMAGIFDGEGCIHIVKRKPDKKNKNSLSPSYSLRLGINISSKVIPYFFLSVCGGGVHKKERREDFYKDTWEWTLCGSPAAELLKNLLPYLKIKRVEAELGIRFQAAHHHGGYGQGIKKPEKISVLEEADYILMKSLKKEAE